MALPDAAVLAWWLTAWLRGQVSPDDLVDAVLGDDAAHHVVPLDGGEPESLVLALASLRASGATGAGLALPAPGLPVGLGGPAQFNHDALEVGEAVVLDGTGLGLVPFRAGAGVVWRTLPAGRRQLTDLGEADRSLRSALITTADRLARLDVAQWRPEVADELLSLHRPPVYVAPPGVPQRAVELAGRASHAWAIVELALEDHGSAISAHEIMAREDALRPLDLAARTALVAACSPEVWPPD